MFIAELEARLESYAASKPYATSMILDQGEYKIQVTWAALGNEPGAILGDAVHNMRTALDLMASELARHFSKTDKDVYFPFAKSADEIEKMIEKRFVKAGPAACDIVRTLKPYNGGNAALRAIHDLDIRDKHTNVIDTPRSFDAMLYGSYNIDNPKDGAFDITINSERYFFPDDTALAGQDIVPTLKALVNDVESIIELFAPLIAHSSAGAGQVGA